MLYAFHIGGLQIPLYFLTIVIGVSVAVLVVVKRPYVATLNRDDILYSAIYSGIGVIIGAKLLYLVTIAPVLAYIVTNHLLTIGIINELLKGGYVFFGGLAGGIAGAYIYARQYKVDFWDLAETLTPGIPLVHAFGRIGCFCAGCCYGVPVDPPLGMLFNDSPITPHDIYLLPIQLIESAFNFALFALIFVVSRKRRPKKDLLCLYLTVYSVGRFIIEFFRYDAARGALGALSTSQWICIVTLIVVAVILFRRKTKTESDRVVL
ncbi:MAG: prolipoprotein diacylglyceryl transferase [Clostridiales Family XIII bacterium]|jgi:phosphatidylglycerol:prolipoprotein diacylglycerol transferase|nr:prolipoprotein diacylglyceryl transferase [Clostridiales Family XIII bacterium]